jgi:hypothetical protein
MPHIDEASEYLVHHLANLGAPIFIRGERAGNRDCDLYLPDVVSNYWLQRLDRSRYHSQADLEQEKFLPFYDAAWQLCRMGVLRPGVFAAKGTTLPAVFGDHYTITAFGIVWLQDAKDRPYIDPSRLSQLLCTFSKRFGEGYEQRATESVKSYLTNNWLAACAMAGAAAESILIALAVEKSGDEEKTLKTYNGRNGRKLTTQLLLNGAKASIQSQLGTALQILHYWRDDASHGMAAEITEIQANASVMQLLSLAQFADKYWDTRRWRGQGPRI